MKQFIILSIALFVVMVEAFSQTAPSGYTTNYQLRKWASGANPSSDSLNANWTQIDTKIRQPGTITLDSINFSGTATQNLINLFKGTGGDTNQIMIYRTVSGDRYQGLWDIFDNGKTPTTNTIQNTLRAVNRGRDSTIAQTGVVTNGHFFVAGRRVNTSTHAVSGAFNEWLAVYNDSTVASINGTNWYRMNSSGNNTWYGNGQFGGTLGVTGATTLSSTLLTVSKVRVNNASLSTYPLEVLGSDGDGIRFSNGTIHSFVGAYSVAGGAIIGTLTNHPLIFWVNNANVGNMSATGALTTAGQVTINSPTAGLYLQSHGALDGWNIAQDSTLSLGTPLQASIQGDGYYAWKQFPTGTKGGIFGSYKGFGIGTNYTALIDTGAINDRDGDSFNGVRIGNGSHPILTISTQTTPDFSSGANGMLIYGDTVDVNAANWLRLRAGNTNGIAINSPTTFSNQLHSLGTVNAGTATASTGDSIQVTVTGITSSAIIVACYAKNSPTALTDIPPAVGNVQTNKFTIFATSGKNVNYFIGHK